MTIATDVINVNLDKGLDTVTPPILRETGSLLDCLNYEISDTMGYRRCDGYERYDGFADGGTLTYYVMQVDGASTPTTYQTVTGAALDDPSKLVPNEVLGIVVELGAVVGSLKTVTVALYTDYNRFPVGYSLKIGGNAYTVTQAATSLRSFYTNATASAYYAKVILFQQQLRVVVNNSDAAVAGLHYSSTQLYKAVDNQVFFTSGSFAAIAPGQSFSYGTKTYTALYVTTNRMEAMVLDDGPFAPTFLVQPLNGSGAAVGPTISINSPFVTPALTAYMVFVNNPNADNYLFGTVGNKRGDIRLIPSFQVGFIDGQGGTTAPVAGTAGLLYDSGGTPKGSITIDSSFVTSGTWAGSNAAGTGQFNFDVASNQYAVVGDTVRTSAGVILYTISSVAMVNIPGTGMLKANSCFYQWGTYNFFAAAGFSGVGGSGGNIFGTTGCSRGFWVTRKSWGHIYSQADASLDKPKYISMHCRAQLALGFVRGSVQLSVVGEPMNFSGVDGAQEAGMGDYITGLLESQGTSTIVLCRGSIARLSGVGLSLQQETISGKIGAFDYTGANVGGTPVFTNQNGVSTLEQSASYGDFVGERATSQLSTRLLPKLIDDSSSFETGGTVCAFPVRAKDQYRLVLKDGTIYSVAFTSQGPKVMVSDLAARYDTTILAYVPMAWSSEVDFMGREQLHVAFDLAAAKAFAGEDVNPYFPDPKVTYKLDYGWGFDGGTFTAFFDIAHVFTSGGVANGTTDKVRMHGMGYGMATLNITTSSLEVDYDMSFMSAIQDISMPITPVLPYLEYSPVMSIVDTAGWGLATKIRINNTKGANSELLEPPHTCQVMQVHVTTDGAIDS